MSVVKLIDDNGNVVNVVDKDGFLKAKQYGSIVSVNEDGTVNSEQPKEYRILSGATKPTSNIALYSTLIELDTTNDYYWDGSEWVLM